jgi:hypothetical protein
MADDFGTGRWDGKLGRASGRASVGENQYATIAVTCRIRARAAPTEQGDELGEEYLASTTRYAVALCRALADKGALPRRLEVDAECEVQEVHRPPRLVALLLAVRGDVHGIDEQSLAAAVGEPALLRSVWDLSPTAKVEVVAKLLGEAHGRSHPAAEATAAEAAPTPSPEPTRRSTRRLRALALLAVVLGLGVAYLLVETGTPSGVGGLLDGLLPRASGPVLVVTQVASPQATAQVAATVSATEPRSPVAVAITAAPATAAAAPTTSAPSATASAALQTTTQTPTLSPVTPPAPGAPAATGASPAVPGRTGFVETFADNQRRWPDNQQSTAWLIPGGYRLTPREASRFVAVRAPAATSFSDVRVSAVFRKLGGPVGGGYGLILRDQSQVPLDGLTQSGRYYVFEVGDKGEFGIWRRSEEQWIDIVPWTRSAAVHVGNVDNELQAQARGSELDLFINGTQVASGQDSVLADGSVGVFAGGDGNDVLLTRFVVEPLN